MSGQMCWLSSFSGDETKVLHLRQHPGDAWQPYTALRQFSVKDYQVPGGSKGWSTYQQLTKSGWTLIPTDQATFSVSQLSPQTISSVASAASLR